MSLIKFDHVIVRDARDARYSTSGSCRVDAADLDWDNWFMDGVGTDEIYIHVRRYRPDERTTYHRIYPKRIKGRVVRRIGVTNGMPAWLHDKK